MLPTIGGTGVQQIKKLCVTAYSRFRRSAKFPWEPNGFGSGVQRVKCIVVLSLVKTLNSKHQQCHLWNKHMGMGNGLDNLFGAYIWDIMTNCIA